MDKQDKLAAVIVAAWDENGEVPFPLYEREAQRIAAAVRAYMVSDEAVLAAARAMAAEINLSLDWFGEPSRNKYLRQARAALSAATGDLLRDPVDK
ncbi:hypothetical protein [Sphingopyxis sp. PET50]|uniref:hypothetical protein n=1 Tax=Sphingopyxis sp. PET50 TaxID=2976533 RepID=UPI0021B088D2|nr:hypothetical protein [Sphingopyxis sp. PET50]